MESALGWSISNLRPNVLNLNDFVLRHFDLLQLALTSKIAKMESSNVQTQAHLSHSNEPPSSMSKTYLEPEDDNQLSLCCLCGKTFPTISSLHYHIDSEHDDANDDGDSASTAEPSSSASDHCLSPSKPVSKRAFPITSLEDYRSGEAYSCPLCKRRFPGQISLKVHIETIHNGQRSATCEICEKRFSTLSYLRLHISTVHEGLKAYVCSICSKSYTQKHSLKKHVSTAHHQNPATKPNGALSGQTSLSSTTTSHSPTSTRPPSTPSRGPRRRVSFVCPPPLLTMLTVVAAVMSTPANSSPPPAPPPRCLLLLLCPLQSILKTLNMNLLPGNRPKERTAAEAFLF
ncbi:hypothetical protein AAHC03_026164 [Spirometra sp. Aus1]